MAQIEPVGGGFKYSVTPGRLSECNSVAERFHVHRCAVREVDCDNLLDAISLEYERLLRTRAGG